MTLGFAMFTIGAVFIYTALKNMTVADVFLGREGTPGPPVVGPFTGAEQTASGGGGGGSWDGTAGTIGTASSTTGSSAKGVGTWRGTKVAAWMIPMLQEAVRNGWDGCLSSGYRTPAYSESLCYDMCGAPTCSGSDGACAGVGSNHSGSVKPKGAIDVCNTASMEAAMAKMGNPLQNNVAGDSIHFSVSGY